MRFYFVFLIGIFIYAFFLVNGGLFVFAEEPQAEQSNTQSSNQSEEVPQKVGQKAVHSATLPAKPVLRVPNYPDQEKWYNSHEEVIVFWDTPDDLLQVSTRVSGTPDEKPGTRESQLYNGKNFGFFEEGIWYVRAQFRNNRGWGPLAYYKIQIDRTAPIVSDIVLNQENENDPEPRLEFRARDVLSGIFRIAIFVDGKEIAEATSSAFTLPSQKAGAHTVSVVAFDNAGNRSEESRGFHVEPLPQPTILFATHSLSEGDAMFVSGNGSAQKTINLKIYDGRGNEILNIPTVSNTLGEWEVVLKNPLSPGSYKILAQASDERGAVSNLSDPVDFNVIPRIVLSFGGIFYLGFFELLLFIALFIIAFIAIIAWRRVSGKKSDEVYSVIAERDVELITLLETDLDSIEDWIEKNPDVKAKEKAEVGYLFKKARDTVKKVKAYLGKEFKK